jgi:hypothetical protein
LKPQGRGQKWRLGMGRGVRLHPDGYLQVTRRGPYRFWMEHRMVMMEACKEWCYYDVSDGKLPERLTVEHLDHNRQHNCRGNLMLLDKVIHDAISLEYRWRRWREMQVELEEELKRERETPPDWVMVGEGGEDEGGGDGDEVDADR